MVTSFLRNAAIEEDLSQILKKNLGSINLFPQSQLQFSSSPDKPLLFGEGFALLNRYISLASLKTSKYIPISYRHAFSLRSDVQKS